MILGDSGFAIKFGIGVVHRGLRFDGLHYRVTDQVGKGHLAASPASKVIVDHGAVIEE